MSTSTPYIPDAPVRALTREEPRGWWHLPAVAIVTGIAVLIAATMLLLRGVEPFATWYYNFAWYPVLLAADGVVALVGGAGNKRRGEFLLLGRMDFLLTVLGWSVVVWLFYEVFNFRLQNWYYVFLPENRFNRWAGTIIAFATVLPAVFVAEGILSGRDVARGVRWKRFTVTKSVVAGMRIAGVIMLALVLVWPRYFFPLVWGATMLLVEPENYKRSKAHSLLADLERGEPGRLLRLLLGGAMIGFTWEMLNINARCKWIYTVPGLEELKIFEMPVPGFIGFPPFAVECFILWQAIVLSGLAVPRIGKSFYASRSKRIGAAIAAVVFSAGTLIGMELMTVDSFKPELSELIGAKAAPLRAAGYDAFSLGKASASDVASIADVDPTTAANWIQTARLASLRGIGTEHLRLLNSIGINSVEELSRQDSRQLIATLEQATGRDFVDARVRVWIRGARRAVAKQS